MPAWVDRWGVFQLDSPYMADARMTADGFDLVVLSSLSAEPAEGRRRRPSVDVASQCIGGCAGDLVYLSSCMLFLGLLQDVDQS